MTAFGTILDEPGVRDALGPGEELTLEQIKLLAILLDPANDQSEIAESIADRLEEFSDTTFGTDINDAREIADTLRVYFSRTSGRYDEFEFELIYSESDGYSSYNVMTGVDADFWLMVGSDSKYLDGSRYNLSGLRAAIRIAETILADHGRCVAKRDQLIQAQLEP